MPPVALFALSCTTGPVCSPVYPQVDPLHLYDPPPSALSSPLLSRTAPLSVCLTPQLAFLLECAPSSAAPEAQRATRICGYTLFWNAFSVDVPRLQFPLSSVLLCHRWPTSLAHAHPKHQHSLALVV
eukprot:EG_transcript_15237